MQGKSEWLQTIRVVPLYHVTVQQHVNSLQQFQPTAEIEAGWPCIIKVATVRSHTCRSLAQAPRPACAAAQDPKARPTAAHVSSRACFQLLPAAKLASEAELVSSHAAGSGSASPQTQHATAILIRHSEARAASSISSPSGACGRAILA